MPSFFTDRHDPMLAPYHDFIDEFRAVNGKVLTLQVPLESVRAGDVQMVQLFVLAAQHHPDILEKLLFGIEFAFEDPAPLIPGTPADEATWKGDSMVQRWLARVNELLPWGVYFLVDHDARFHALFGDILHRDRDALDIRPIKDGQENIIGMSGEQAQEFLNRILQASVFLLHFCRPAGLEPRPAIEALMAEFDVEEHTGWDYDRVYAHFQGEVAQGFRIRAASASREEIDRLAPWEPTEEDEDDA